MTGDSAYCEGISGGPGLRQMKSKRLQELLPNNRFFIFYHSTTFSVPRTKYGFVQFCSSSPVAIEVVFNVNDAQKSDVISSCWVKKDFL